MATLLVREDQAIIQCEVAGVQLPSVYSWTSLEGGHAEATNVNTRPGGMKPAVELGGPAARTDATVKRQYSVQLHPYIIQLENQVGKGNVRITYQMLDANGNIQPGIVTWTGILKQVQTPNLDANNSSAAFLGLVVGLNQLASIS